MKRTLHILILVFLCKASVAQVPGYMGKHIGISYQNSFFLVPTFWSDPSSNDGFPYPYVWPTMKNGVTADITITRKLNLDISYSYFTSQAFFGESGIYDPNYGGTMSIFPWKRLHRIHTHFIEGSLNLFLGKYIAPVGTHLILKAGSLRGGLPAGEKMVLYSYDYSAPVDTVEWKEAASDFRIGLGVGRRNIITGNLYFRTSFMMYAFSSLYYDRNKMYSTTLQKYLPQWYGYNVRLQNRFELNVGIGILLF